MRRAINKAFLQVPLETQKVDESPSNVQGTCRKPKLLKQENAHTR